ncbi:hypothetical protein IC582_029912 [Cucumis melo]
MSLILSSVLNPRHGSTKSSNSPFWILLIAIVDRLISCLCLVISTAGFEDISSTNTTPKLNTSLFFVSWKKTRQSEIGNFDIEVVVNENVGGFNIAVDGF